jgi:hypothetical protein
MGTPDNIDRYVPIQVGEWARRYGTIYIPLELWGRLRPGSREFVFYLEHVGRFTLEFDSPVHRLKP